MKKKYAKPFITPKVKKYLMVLKEYYVENSMTLPSWFVFTRYIIIGEIMPKLEARELGDLYTFVADFMSEITTQQVKLDGKRT